MLCASVVPSPCPVPLRTRHHEIQFTLEWLVEAQGSWACRPQLGCLVQDSQVLAGLLLLLGIAVRPL
jgi:hypothetical protein